MTEATAEAEGTIDPSSSSSSHTVGVTWRRRLGFEMEDVLKEEEAEVKVRGLRRMKLLWSFRAL